MIRFPLYSHGNTLLGLVLRKYILTRFILYFSLVFENIIFITSSSSSSRSRSWVQDYNVTLFVLPVQIMEVLQMFHFLIIHHTFLLTCECSTYVTWLNIRQLKLGNMRVIFPNFQNHTWCKKYLMDHKDNSLHLARKYAWICVLGHYLFLNAHSFALETLSENIRIRQYSRVNVRERGPVLTKVKPTPLY